MTSTIQPPTFYASPIASDDLAKGEIMTASMVRTSASSNGCKASVKDLKFEILELKKQLKESEERANALTNLGAGSEAIVILQDINNKEAAQVYVSDNWPYITGYSREELVGMSFIDLESPKDRYESLNRHRLKMSGEATPGLYEMEIIHKNGSVVPVEITGASTMYRGNRANIVYIRDISQRKYQEKTLRIERNRLSKLIEDAPVTILELDFSQGIVLINGLKENGIADFYTYFIEHPDTLAQFLCTLRVLSINRFALETYMADISKLLDLLQRVSDNKLTRCDISEEDGLCFDGLAHLYSQLLEGSKIPVWEFPRPTNDGKYKYIRDYLNIMADHEDDLSWVMIVEVDITERVLAENELMKYQQHLEHLVRLRTLEIEKLRQKEKKLYKAEHILRQKLESKVNQQVEFTHRLIHDLKTPLSPMLAASEILIHQTTDEKLKRIALNIHRGADKLNHSINDLVDITRGEVNILQLDYREVDIPGLLNVVLEFFKVEANRKRQQLKLKISGELPHIWGDQNRLQQVIMNLLENALRHTPSGGHITLRARARRGHLLVDVTDTGLGIDESVLPHVFEPYYVAQHSSRPQNGLGLGLPLSKMVIELHRGKIWVKSKRNVGTTVVFSIPICRNPIEISGDVK